jgi:glycosyltransferase involved in cell wall biosynthesis
VAHHSSGFLVPVGETDKMASYAIELLSNDDKLHQFKVAAFTRAKEFDIKKIVPKYIELYKQAFD